MPDPAGNGTVVAFPIRDLPEFRPGDDIGSTIVKVCQDQGVSIGSDDVIVIASKIVAKAENRFVAAHLREQALADETVRQVAARWLPELGRATRVVQTRSGPILVAAGIDASDVPSDSDGSERVLLLPAEPDDSARRIRAAIVAATGVRPAVLVTDTAGRPWRLGVSDFALGAAGLTVLDDRRGTLDRDGRVMGVTVRALADEIAAFADLAKGKGAGTPVAVVRGLAHLVIDDDGPGAQSLVRFGPTDWFAHGSDEAVRAALGLRQGPMAEEVRPPPMVPPPTGVTSDAAHTAIAMAEGGGRWPQDVTVTLVQNQAGVEILLRGGDYGRGVATERLRVALFTVRLEALVSHDTESTTLALIAAD